MTLKHIALYTVAALTLVPLVGFTLPSAKLVERSAVVEATPDRLFPLIASNSGFQQFNPYRDTDPELKIELYGPAFGVGSGFSFDGKEGRGTQVITQIDNNRSVTMQIDLGAMGKPVQTISLSPASAGTEVSWSVNAEFGANPLARVFGLFMDRMMGPTLERGLRNLSDTALTVSGHS